MRPTLASFALILAVAAPMAAQDKPAATSALAGNWTFDPSRSDSMPGSPSALMGGGAPQGPGGAAAAAAAVGGAPSGGGGGGRGRGGGGGGGGGSGASGSGGARLGSRGGGARMDDPKMRMLMSEARPAPTMVITATDAEVTFADDQGRIKSWQIDGKKHQEAQMEGGVIETEGKWKGKALLLERGIPEAASVRREFKTSDDGSTLELKTVFESGGRKVEKKYVYTRKP